MNEYTPDERRQLLALAHLAIESRVKGKTLEMSPPSAHLSEKRGAFTTLHLHGQLRGCIGYVEAAEPLYRTIIDTAASAAFDDPRFPPLTSSEEPYLQIEISVLSPMFPIAPEDVIVGTHGLLISQHGRRGLLLPQVPLEWGWDRDTFLAHTCRKAGLPVDAWKHGAKIEAFTAEVFSEPVPHEVRTKK